MILAMRWTKMISSDHIDCFLSVEGPVNWDDFQFLEESFIDLKVECLVIDNQCLGAFALRFHLHLFKIVLISVLINLSLYEFYFIKSNRKLLNHL